MIIDSNSKINKNLNVKSPKKSGVKTETKDTFVSGEPKDKVDTITSSTINKADETGTTPVSTPPAGPSFDDAFSQGRVSDSAGISMLVMKDGGLEFLANLINSATKSIDLKIYIMTGNEATTMNALLNAAKRGVKVRVMIEQTPFYWVKGSDQDNPSQLAIDELRAAGAEVTWTNPKYSFNQVTHEKSAVIDGDKGVILTGNLGASAHTNLDIGAILLKDPKDVKDLSTVFNYDHDRLNEQNKNLMDMIPDTNLVVSPDNSRKKIGDLIDSAKKSIIVMNQALSDEDFTMRLLNKHRNNVDVEAIVSNPVIGEGNLSSATFLKSKGVNVRYMENPYLHAKAVAVDEKDDDHSDDVAYIGSQNFSTAALNKNREMGIIFHDPEDGLLKIINKYLPNSQDVPDRQISASATYTGGIIKKAIQTAEQSIIMSAVMLTDDSIVKSLIKAKQDGKDVKVIIPDKPFGDKPINQKAIDALQQAAGPLKVATKDDNIEGTTLVVDSCRAVISDEGLTWSAFNKDHNLGMIDTDAKDVSDFEQLLKSEFNGDMLNVTGVGEDILAGDNKKTKVLNELKKATKAIEIETKDLNDRDVIALLKKKSQDNVKIRVMCSDSKQNRDALKDLIGTNNLEIVFNSMDPIGSNYINVDNQEIIVGGGSLDYKSLSQGKGMGVIIDDKGIVQEKTAPDFTKNWVRGSVSQAQKSVEFDKKNIVVRDAIDDAILSSMFAKAKYGIQVSIKAEEVTGSPLEKSVNGVNKTLNDIVNIDTSTDDGKKKLTTTFDTFDINTALKYQENLRNTLKNLPSGEKLVKFTKAQAGEIKDEFLSVDGKSTSYKDLKGNIGDITGDGDGGEG